MREERDFAGLPDGIAHKGPGSQVFWRQSGSVVKAGEASCQQKVAWCTGGRPVARRSSSSRIPNEMCVFDCRRGLSGSAPVVPSSCRCFRARPGFQPRFFPVPPSWRRRGVIQLFLFPGWRPTTFPPTVFSSLTLPIALPSTQPSLHILSSRNGLLRRYASSLAPAHHPPPSLTNVLQVTPRRAPVSSRFVRT
jgi:hypothetical protein